MNTGQLAQQIAKDELGISPEDGEWINEGTESFWCPEYTEEESEKVSRIVQHITKIFNDTDWKKVADNQNYEVGDKVKFLVEIERCMTTIVPKDSTGTIAEIDEGYLSVTCHDEQCAKDLAEWEGQIYLCNTPVTDFDKYDYEGLDSIEKV